MLMDHVCSPSVSTLKFDDWNWNKSLAEEYYVLDYS